jgi:hypothetical protein
MMSKQSLDAAWLRQQIVGVDSTFETPFGERLMVYCDYTASGRCLRFVESYIQSLQRVYANTHTEDDITGRSMTQLLREAETAIKESVNAGPDGRIVAVGTGATGAIEKLQQIVGVALPPATRKQLFDVMDSPDCEIDSDCFRRTFNEKGTNITRTRSPGGSRWQPRSRYVSTSAVTSTSVTSRNCCRTRDTGGDYGSVRSPPRRMSLASRAT